MVLLNTNTKAHNTRPNSSRDNRERSLIGYVARIVDCDKGQGDMHQSKRTTYNTGCFGVETMLILLVFKLIQLELGNRNPRDGINCRAGRHKH